MAVSPAAVPTVSHRPIPHQHLVRPVGLTWCSLHTVLLIRVWMFSYPARVTVPSGRACGHTIRGD